MKVRLNVTRACNLACDYCYYRDSNNGVFMSDAVLEKSLGFFTGMSLASGVRSMGVTFFGGEPLAAFDTVRTAVGMARRIEKEKGVPFTFAVATNGTLLNNTVLDYLEAERVLIYLSLDGAPRTHDSHRRFTDGRGSFAGIMPHLPRLSNMAAAIETVIMPDTAADFTDNVRFFLDNGFDYLVASPDFTAPWTPESLSVLGREYEKTAELYYALKKKGREFRLNLLCDKIDIYLNRDSYKASCCSLGRDQWLVDADGSIYPCVRFADGREPNPYRVGHVSTGLDLKTLARVRAESAPDKAPCRECTIKDRCLGNGCGCLSYQTTGTLTGLSPFACEHERLLCRVADSLGARLSR